LYISSASAEAMEVGDELNENLACMKTTRKWGFTEVDVFKGRKTAHSKPGLLVMKLRTRL